MSTFKIIELDVLAKNTIRIPDVLHYQVSEHGYQFKLIFVGFLSILPIPCSFHNNNTYK